MVHNWLEYKNKTAWENSLYNNKILHKAIALYYSYGDTIANSMINSSHNSQLICFFYIENEIMLWCVCV